MSLDDDQTQTVNTDAAETPTRRKRNWLSMILDVLVAVAVFFAGYGTHWWQTSYSTAKSLAACGGVDGGARPQSWSELQEVGYPVEYVSWGSGEPSADKVRLGIVLDYQCPYSQAFIQELLPKLMERQDVYIEVYDLPLDFHGNAAKAASAAHCADNQGRALEFVQTLTEQDPTVAQVEEVASNLGIEMEEFSACVDAGISYSQESADLFLESGVSSTPSVIIDGRLLSGLSDWKTLSEFIDQAAANR